MTFVPFHASPVPTTVRTGFQELRRTQPLLLILVGGILLTLCSIMGCSDAPQFGSMLTADDVDRYIFSTEDAICLESGADSACITLMPEDGPDANGIYGPIVYSHPTRLIYVFYRGGVPALRPAGTGQAVDVGPDLGVGVDGIGTDVSVEDVSVEDVGVEDVGLGVDSFVDDSFISSNTNEDNTKNDGGGNDDSLRSKDNNNNNNNNGNNGNNGNNNNNNGDGNNGGSSDDCESGYIVWTQLVGDSKQSGVICKKYTVIDEGNNMITFTGSDGKVDGGDNESIKEYVAVETGYTYEEASDRAPQILREWAEREDE